MKTPLHISIKKLWPKRLAVQVAVVFLSLTISTITLFTIQTVNEETERTTARMLQQAKVLASNIASTSSGYLLRRDYTSIENLLLRSGRFPGLIEAKVSDTKGKLLGDILRGNDDEPVAQFGQPNLLVPEHSKTTVDISQNKMSVWEPIVLGHTIGWVKIAYDLEVIDQLKQRIWIESLILGLLLVSLAVVMLMFLLRHPLRIIEKYTAFSNRLDTNEGEQIKVKSSSLELTNLGVSLNHASERLHLQSQTIVNAMDEVERVAAFAKFNPDMVLSLDAEGNVIYMNPSTEKKIQTNGNNAADIARIKSYLPKNIDELCVDAIKNNTRITDIEVHTNNETYLWNLEPLEGQQILHCYATDITKRKKAEKLLTDSESRYRTLFDSANDAILLLDNEKCIDCNPMSSIMFGVSSDRIIGQSISYFSPPNQADGKSSIDYFNEKYNTALKGQLVAFEWQCYNDKEEAFYTEIHLSNFELSGKNYVLAIIRDISERKEAEKKLLHQATFDSLTNLPNRFLAFDRLEQAIKQTSRNNKKVVIMFIDVDQFKKINDTLGHASGDKLLIEVGERLLTCVRGHDTVARLGGDEFLIITDNIKHISEIDVIAQRILYKLSRPYMMGSHELYFTASIGISSCPDDSSDPQTLLRNADTAMYLAKETGRNTFKFYTPELNQQAKDRLNMESKLRHAIENNELTVNYQPQIDIREGRLIGAEALLRWTNPELGTVPPDKFIPFVEDLGLMHDIGEWILKQACRDVVAWQSLSPTPIRVAVNISPVQFRGSRLLDTIIEMIKQNKITPELLELEITESLLVEDAPETTGILFAIKQMGIYLTLDDFGTGYSSLSYLKRFHFDVLKIDQAFMRDVMTQKDDANLCKAIIAMASSLNLKIVGEGIEDKDQLNFLLNNGADIAQGYYYSKALPLEDFRKFVKDWNKVEA